MLRPQHQEQVDPVEMLNNCVLLLHTKGQNGAVQFIDSSNNTKIITPYGNAKLSNAHYRFGGTSGYFDGSTSYLTIPSSTDFDFGSNDFTISVWVNTTISTSMGLLVKANTNYPFYLYLSGGYACIASYQTTGTANFTITGSTTLVNTGTWHNISAMRIGNTVYLYVDGISQGTATFSGSINATTDIVIIGANYSYGGKFNGYIDELYINNGAGLPIGMIYPQKRPFGYPIGGTS